MSGAPLQRLSAAVRLVRAPNPSPMTLDGTNTYVIGAGPAIVLDPGPDDDAHLERVLAEAGEVAVVLLSHRHPDHAESADRFGAMAGAPVAAMAGSRPGAVDVSDGERIDAGGVSLRAIATPGHASDHLCFLLEGEGALFTGDHILGQGTTVVAHPDGDMTQYLDSLRRLRALAVGRLYPGHGPVVDDPGPVIEYYISHRIEREGQVLAALAAGDRSVEDIVERIYVDVDPVLHPVAALSVRAHLEKLGREGRLPPGLEFTRA